LDSFFSVLLLSSDDSDSEDSSDEDEEDDSLSDPASSVFLASFLLPDDCFDDGSEVFFLGDSFSVVGFLGDS